ncbi:hypothetical protein ACSBR2_029161 [Camellia fascicularis]
MPSFTSIATSTTRPRRMCAYGYGQCVVKISRSNKYPRRPYFACPRPMTNKACAKFKTKTLEHHELMETAFTRAAVTGKNHWTPGEKCNEPAVVSSDSVKSIGLRPFVDPIPACAANVETKSSMEPVDAWEKRKRTPFASCAKLKKATSGASIIAESTNKFDKRGSEPKLASHC